MRVSFAQGAVIAGVTLLLWTLYDLQFGNPPTREETALLVIGSAVVVLLMGWIARRIRPGRSQ